MSPFRRLGARRRRDPRTDVPTDEAPIFVHGISRAGGTLVTTILDAHPRVAMSYELYPELLELDDRSTRGLRRLAKGFDQAPSVRKAAGKLPEPARTFFLRVERSGLDQREVAATLRAHADHDDLTTPSGRIALIARFSRAKMRKAAKERWGVKCGKDYAPLRALWPNAVFVGLLRDGRDVLASRQTTGSFDHDPINIARAWCEDIHRFQELLDDSTVRALQVRYEELVADPEPQIRRIVEVAGIEFDPRLLRHNEERLTVFDAHHLSMDRITRPIDASQVGRWRRDVSDADLEAFMGEAGATLEAAGYAPA